MDADEVYSEVPFSYRKQDAIYHGIIDLIYNADGKLHIIDWKTNRDGEGLSEHYQGQLEAYREAVKRMLGEETEDALIYHIPVHESDIVM